MKENKLKTPWISNLVDNPSSIQQIVSGMIQLMDFLEEYKDNKKKKAPTVS